MNAMPQADSNPVYAKNLMILSAVVAGKAILSVAIFTIVRDIMATDIIASCVLVVAIILLVRGGVLRSSILLTRWKTSFRLLKPWLFLLQAAWCANALWG